MMPMKLGLAYESCFGDPYRMPHERVVEDARDVSFLSPPHQPRMRSGADGWLTSILQLQQHALTVGTRPPHRQADSEEAANRDGVKVDSPPRPPAMEADEGHVAAADDYDSDRRSRDGNALPAENVAMDLTPHSPSRPSPSPASSTCSLPPQRQHNDKRRRASRMDAPCEPVGRPPATRIDDNGLDSNTTTTTDAKKERSNSPMVCDAGNGTHDLACEQEEAEQKLARARAGRVVEEELRGGVLAAVGDTGTDNGLAEVVDHLYDKIRLNAVQVVALDDLNFQLRQLLSVDAQQHQQQIKEPEKREPMPSETVSSKAAATSQTLSAVDQTELALYLYGLREQVVQMKKALVDAEAAQATAQRKRQKEAARAAKHGRRVRVEVVRAYESPLQPRVKPPFQPAALPAPRKRRAVPLDAANGTRSVLELSVSSSMRSPATRWASVYHDGSAVTSDAYPPDEDEVVVRHRVGRDGHGRRHTRRPRLSASPPATSTERSSLSSSASSAVPTSSSASFSSSPLDSERTISGSDVDSSSPTVRTESASDRRRRDASSVSSSRSEAAGSPSTSERSRKDDSSQDTDDSDDSSTGADIFWARRMEALKRKKAREAEAGRAVATSSSSSSSTVTASTRPSRSTRSSSHSSDDR